MYGRKNKTKGVRKVLTAKQEKYVQNLVKGMSQREAYKDAYDVNKMSDNAVDREASLLLKNPKVTKRYKELVDKIAKPTIMTAQERLEFLTGVIKETEKEHKIHVTDDGSVAYDTPADLSTKLKAIDLMNKMQGEYITKIEGEMKVTKLEDLI